MSQFVPFHPLPPDVDAAIDTLMRAQTFDADAFAVLNRERWRRIPILLAYMLPFLGLGAGLVWLADRAGWLGFLALPAYAFFPVIFVGIMLNLVRGRTFKEELRLSAAITRWEGARGRIHDKPVERKR